MQRNLSSVSFTTQQAARRNQVKAIRWTKHAMQNIVDRSVDQRIAEKAIQDPEFTVADPPDREIRMRRYFDEDAQQMMLLRVVIEEVESEIVVVTLYKTSQLKRYLKGLLP